MQCLGYRYGSGCKKTVKSSQGRRHWDNYQLCYNCGHDERTLPYRNRIDSELQRMPIIQ